MLLFIGVLVVLSLWAMTVYNRLVQLRNGAEEAFRTIDVFLKQRYDLIPNLVNTIKGYTQYESSTLEKVIEARNVAMHAGPAERGAAENTLTGALKSVFALAESYPDLKANQEFMHLQTTLTGLEESIQRARRFYNASVRDLNNGVEMFPGNVIASYFGFHRMDYLVVPGEETANVKVEF
jgi:LemA protein